MTITESEGNMRSLEKLMPVQQAIMRLKKNTDLDKTFWLRMTLWFNFKSYAIASDLVNCEVQ